MRISGTGSICNGAQGTEALRVSATKDGGKVVSFNISVSNGKNKQTGEWNESTFYNVVCFGYVAEDAAHLAAKDHVYISGRLTKEFWTNNQGQQMDTTKIIADEVYKLAPRGEAQPAPRPSKRVPPPSQATSDDLFPDTEFIANDVPF